MNKKHIKVIVIIGLLVFVLLMCLSFYAGAYIKGNNCIVYVNKNIYTEENFEDCNWISPADFKELRIVDEEEINDNTYISLKTKPKFSILAWNKIAIDYEITAVVNDGDTWEEIAEHKQNRKITFVFSGFKWTVKNVT